jgi:hypothetical protein
MKTLTVEKNRAFLYHEMSGKNIGDILTYDQKSLRFDLRYHDEDRDIQRWRATILLVESEPMLEIKNYEGVKVLLDLEPFDIVSHAAALALHYVWEEIERGHNRPSDTKYSNEGNYESMV